MTRDHASDVRALRQQSNDAIAVRDADRVVSFMDDAVEVSVAGGPVLRGAAANRDAFAQQMAERGFGGYVRTPAQVTTHDNPLRVEEQGEWVGRWRVNARQHEQRGTYSAEWRITPAGWRIVREIYRQQLG
ncbi:MAG TPA: nuclear transport factor 2 family protein [Gemmatimonas sp.]|uniref:YybH family protein n=1 Tax=Gemmatimonas sp. TaxID=1962908 RepID=UPI002ED8CC4A